VEILLDWATNKKISKPAIVDFIKWMELFSKRIEMIKSDDNSIDYILTKLYDTQYSIISMR